MMFQNGIDPLLELVDPAFWGKAKIEPGSELTGNDIAGTSTTVQVGKLEGGGRKVSGFLIPYGAGQFSQRWCRQMNGVARQLGIGHMALFSFDCENPG